MRTIITLLHNQDDTFTTTIERQPDPIDANPPQTGLIRKDTSRLTTTLYWLSGYISGLTGHDGPIAHSIAQNLTTDARKHTNGQTPGRASITMQTLA